MSKIASLLSRKAAPKTLSTSDEPSPADSMVDFDEELFSAIGAQLGGNNEALRNLLLNANHKIGELDTIKEAVGKLVGPVSKALRDFETEKADKINLQAALSNTRTAYGKLRNEVTELERKSAALERETEQLRKDLAFAENAAKALETIRGELAIDIAARRAQVTDLEGRLNQEIAETKSLRDDNQRLSDWRIGADKRIVALETEINGLRQKLVLSEDEKRALQASFEKTSGDASRIARRLAEAESNLSAAQTRMRQLEGTLAEVSTERARLKTTIDEAAERHAGEISTAQMRYDALQARAAATDRLLSEARDQLHGRAEDARVLERRLSETTQERDALASRIASLEGEVAQGATNLHESEHQRATLLERGSALAKAYNSKESELARAQETIAALSDQVSFLQTQLVDSKQGVDDQLNELNEALRREKVERSVVEGALDAARKDFGRLMREVMALERQRTNREPAPELRSANAA